MPNKYDKPLFLALRKLMEAKLYDAVVDVIDTALLDNVPLEDLESEKDPKSDKGIASK